MRTKHFLCLNLIALLLFTSCPKTPLCPPLRHELRISFYNQGFDELDVTLFPKKEYWGSDSTIYKVASFFDGYQNTEHTLLQGNWSSGEILYYTEDTAITPSALLSRVFDSILLEYSTVFYDTVILFTPDRVVNYEVNPFTTDSIWIFEEFTTNLQTMHCENEVLVKDYSFAINK